MGFTNDIPKNAKPGILLSISGFALNSLLASSYWFCRSFLFAKNVPILDRLGELRFEEKNTQKRFFISTLWAIVGTSFCPLICELCCRKNSVSPTVLCFLCGLFHRRAPVTKGQCEMDFVFYCEHRDRVLWLHNKQPGCLHMNVYNI